MLRILSVFFLTVLPFSVFAQSGNNPIHIWSEYMATNPDTDDLVDLSIKDNLREPYRTWVVEELLNRDLTKAIRFKLANLFTNKTSEDHLELLWTRLEIENSPAEELGHIFCCTGGDSIRKRILDLLNKRYFTNKELVVLMPSVSDSHKKDFEPWASKILEKFLSQNPTNEDLFSLSKGFYSKFAIEELLKRPLSNRELIYLLGSTHREYRDEILNRIPLVTLNRKELTIVYWMSIEGISAMALELLESETYRNEKEREEYLVRTMTN